MISMRTCRFDDGRDDSSASLSRTSTKKQSTKSSMYFSPTAGFLNLSFPPHLTMQHLSSRRFLSLIKISTIVKTYNNLIYDIHLKILHC